MDTCYKPRILTIPVIDMPNRKRIETVTIKVSQEEKDAIIKISEKEDRPLGYVARELMKRGLALYEVDGKLKSGSPVIRAKTEQQKEPVKKRA